MIRRIQLIWLLILTILNIPLQAAENIIQDEKLSADIPKKRLTAILGFDDRVFSNDPRVGRFLTGSNGPQGTGWLMNGGLVLTAGHVVYGIQNKLHDSIKFIEFNVPYSKSDGAPVEGALEDRYPVKVLSYTNEQDKKDGHDWAILQIGPNEKTGLSAFEKQGGFFRVVKDLSVFGASPLVRVTGYGLDEHPTGTSGKYNSCNRTQQTDKGPMTSEDNKNLPQHIISYEIDTLNGNSGSPVYLVGTHLALAIHNSGNGDNNLGTGFKNNQLYDALKKHINVEQYVDSDYSFTVSVGDGGFFTPFRRLGAALDNIKISGGKLGIVSGYYGSHTNEKPKDKSQATPGVFFPKAPPGKKIAIKALAGKAHIGKVVKK